MPLRARSSTGRRSSTRKASLVKYVGLLYIFSTPLDLVELDLDAFPVRSPTAIVGGLFIAMWVFDLARRNASLPKHGRVLVSGILFVFWSALTTAWSVAPDETASTSLSTVVLLLSAMAIGTVFREQLGAPAWALVLGAFSVAVLTLTFGGPEYYDAGGTTLQGQQWTFQGIDQNALSFHLALGLAAGLYLLSKRGSTLLKVGLLAMVGILVATTLLVGSRSGVGAEIGIFIFLVVILLSAKRGFGLVGAVVLVSIALLPIKFLADAGRIPDRIVQWVSNPVATDSRDEIIALYRETGGDWFLFGVGKGADADYLQFAANSYLNAHSAFWKTWIETGLIGLVLFSGFLLGIAVIAWRSPERDFFLLTGVPIIIFFYTLGPINSNMLWAVFGLALGMPVIARANAHSPLSRSPAGPLHRSPPPIARAPVHEPTPEVPQTRVGR